MSILTMLRCITLDVTDTLIVYKVEFVDYYCMVAKSVGLFLLSFHCSIASSKVLRNSNKTPLSLPPLRPILRPRKFSDRMSSGKIRTNSIREEKLFSKELKKMKNIFSHESMIWPSCGRRIRGL